MRLALLLAIVAALAAGALWIPWERLAMPSVEGFETFILGLGGWGIAASIGLMIAHSFIPFPAELLAIANGMVYGAILGTLITWTGAMLGAFAAFGLARAFGRPLVARLVRRRDWESVDRWLADEGWQVLLVVRLLPIIAFNLINYAVGLTRIGWWTFAWTTGIGILPVTVLMVLMGAGLEVMHWGVWLALLAAILGLGLWIGRRFRTGPRP